MNQMILIDMDYSNRRRKTNDYSQAKLAEETNLSVSYISHIENAKRKASLESIIRIVNVLGITVDELTSRSPTA